MTPTPLPPGADRLEDLLRETFAAHEHLADAPRLDVAAGAPTSGGGRRLAFVGVAAAAAVAAVVAGVTFVGTRGGHLPDAGPRPGPSPSSTSPAVSPPHAPGGSSAENRALATRLAGRVAGDVPTYPGARAATPAEVPPLRRLTMSSSSADHTVTRSRFWTVPGSAKSVAEWYAAHPPPGFTSDGGRAGVGSESDGAGTFINDVYLDQHPPMRYAPAGSSIFVQTTELADGSVGIRATVQAVWRPGRPTTSYLSGVTSIDVRITRQTFGTYNPQRPPRTLTITTAESVDRLVRTFNRLPGWPPFFHSCPAMINVKTYRIVFHTSHGDVTATGPIACYDTLEVRRDGHRVGPYLDHASDLIKLVDGHAGTRR